MSLRSKNWFFTANRFVSVAMWGTPLGGRLLWPAAWLEWGREPSLEIRAHRFSLGWWKWRFQLDLGVWTPIALDGPVDWDRLGIDGYLAWAKKTFGRTWGRIDVERIFRQDPAWKRLTIMGTAHNHYVRVALARAMLSAQDAAVGANAQVSAILEEESKSSEVPMPRWNNSATQHKSNYAEESLMAGLDKLGAKLRRKTDETDE